MKQTVRVVYPVPTVLDAPARPMVENFRARDSCEKSFFLVRFEFRGGFRLDGCAWPDSYFHTFPGNFNFHIIIARRRPEGE
jgi:hypothetical protein